MTFGGDGGDGGDFSARNVGKKVYSITANNGWNLTAITTITPLPHQKF